MRRLMLRTAVVLATLAALAMLWPLRRPAVLLLCSVGLAASCEPWIAALVRRRLPRSAAVALVYALGFLVAAGVIFIAGAEMPEEASRAAGELERLYADARVHSLQQGLFARVLADHLPAATQLLDAGALESFGAGALAWTERALGFVGDALIVLVLSVFWTYGRQPLERLGLSLFPATQRSRTRQLWQALGDGVGAQLRSDLIQSLLAGLFAALGFLAIGAPYAISAALCIALLRLIPLVGPILALGLSFLCGASCGASWGFIAAAGTVALFVWLRFSVGKRLAGAHRHHPILVAVVLTALWAVGGVYALFAAGPIAAALSALGDWLFAEAGAPVDPGRDHGWSKLAKRLDELDALMRRSTNPLPELESVAGRLADLVREAASTDGAASGP
jgi:predicted PurR-regulated permease PerM